MRRRDSGDPSHACRRSEMEMADSCVGGAGVAVAWQRLQGAHSHADGTSRKVNVHLVPLRGNKLRKKKIKFI